MRKKIITLFLSGILFFIVNIFLIYAQNSAYGETETYFNLNYLNKICSVKALNGEETPYYWVI